MYTHIGPFTNYCKWKWFCLLLICCFNSDTDYGWLRAKRGRYLNWTSTAILTRKQIKCRIKWDTTDGVGNMNYYSIGSWGSRDVATNVEQIYLYEWIINSSRGSMDSRLIDLLLSVFKGMHVVILIDYRIILFDSFSW